MLDNQLSKITMHSFKATFIGTFFVFLLRIEEVWLGHSEISGKFLTPPTTTNSEWKSILSAMEYRLKNLDNLYTDQLTPTLETRLEHFQNRISGMEVKLLRIEALLTTKLDRVSENMSSKHFRDDMVQTDLFRKIETAYDGVTHRLAYLDRKLDNVFSKIQSQMDIISKKLETMDDAVTTKHESIESELSDYVAGVDDLKSFFRNAEEKLIVSLEKQLNNTLGKQNKINEISKENINSDIMNTIHFIHENVTKNFETLRKKISFQNLSHDNTEKSIQKLSQDLGKLFNEYASKVSDLGAQVTKSNNKIATHLSIIESVTNSTKIDILKGLRTLMVQISKISNKQRNEYEVVDQRFLADMGETLNSKFDKIIVTQNSFLENCHRLQMDESQLETQISDILNKLIDNFARSSREQHQFLKKIDGLLVKHDVHSKKEIYQIGADVKSILEQGENDSKLLDTRFRQTEGNLEALFVLLQNILVETKANVNSEIPNEKKSVESVRHLEKSSNMTNSEMKGIYQAYSNISVNLMKLNEEIKNISKYSLRNLTENIEQLKKSSAENFDRNITENILKPLLNTNEVVKRNTEALAEILSWFNNSSLSIEKSIENASNTKNLRSKPNENESSDIEELIEEIFFVKNSTEIPSTVTDENLGEIVTKPLLDFDIDVRFSDNSNLTGPYKKSSKDENNENQTEAALHQTEMKSKDVKNSFDYPI